MIERATSIPLITSAIEPTASEDVISEILLDDLQDDELDEDAVINPESFIVLMAQAIDISSAEEGPKEITAPAETPAPSVSLSTEPSNTTQSELIALQAEAVESTNIDQNVALSWINSESFIPPGIIPEVISLAEDIEVEAPEAEYSKQSEPAVTNKSIAHEVLEPGKALTNELESLQKAFALESDNDLLDTTQPPAIDAPSVDKHIDYVPVDMMSVKNETKTSDIRPNLHIPVKVTNPEWAEQFSEKIIWLGQQGLKSALIKIHPEELGPLEISIKVVKDSASISISSHNDHVKGIVEQSLPRLREMMAEQGIQLSEAQIDSEGSSRRSSQPELVQSGFEVEGDDESILTTPLRSRTKDSLIDYFA